MFKRIGFFPELTGGRVAGTTDRGIHDFVRPVGEPDEERLVAYLRAGYPLVDVMEAVPDVFTGEHFTDGMGGSSLLSDGTWLWRQDLAHYVETYHVELPDAFLEFVRRGGFSIPQLSGPELGALVRRESEEVGPNWW